MKRFGSISALVAAFIFVWPPQIRGAEVHRYLLDYEILLAGFEVGNVEVLAELSSDAYNIVVDTRNTGILRLLAGFTSRARSHGRYDPAGVRPQWHQADNVWVGERRFVRNSYREDGGVDAEVSPPAARDDRKEVPASQVVGTVDPLSASLMASLRAGGAEACRGRIAVFDGRRRYNLAFEHAGKDQVSGPAYKGPGIRCRVALERIAGFSSDPWLPRAQSSDRGDIWFAKVRDELPPVPVRLKTDLGIGTVEVNLVSLVNEVVADHEVANMAWTRVGAGAGAESGEAPLQEIEEPNAASHR